MIATQKQDAVEGRTGPTPAASRNPRNGDGLTPLQQDLARILSQMLVADFRANSQRNSGVTVQSPAGTEPGWTEGHV